MTSAPHHIRTTAKKGNDYVIIILTILLVMFGIAMLGSASSNLSQAKAGDSIYYLKHQVLYGLSLGIVGFIMGSLIYYKRYKKIAFIGMGVGIILLLLTFTPLAFETKGASRSVHVGPITFQPAEPLKLLFIMYLAALLANATHKESKRHTTGGFIAFLIILAVVSGLLLQQPATSTAILLSAIALIMYFMSGSRIKYVAIAAGLLVTVVGIMIYVTPYRMLRVETFFHPEQNVQTSGYQISQAKMAIGSGRLLGVGYGQSKTKIKYLPEPLADSIFAVVGEELGFVGSLTLIGLMLALVLRLLFIARNTHDQFGALALVGFGSLIGLQAAINIGAISGLIPLTGMGLPFVSYGGTALTIFMTMIGIANNIAKHNT